MKDLIKQFRIGNVEKLKIKDHDPSFTDKYIKEDAADILKDYLLPVIKELKTIDPDKRVEQRIEKFGKMGFWEETPALDTA